MPYQVKFDDGTQVQFTKPPTQQDIEEAYGQIKGQKSTQQPAPPPQQSIPERIGNAVAPAARDISQALITAPSDKNSVAGDFLGHLSGGASEAYQQMGESQKQAMEQDAQIMKMIQAARTSGNMTRAKQLAKILAIGHDEQQSQPTQEDVATNGQGFSTPTQIIGDFAQTGINALSGGSLSGAGTLPAGLKFAQPALEGATRGLEAVQGVLKGGSLAERGGIVGGAARTAGKATGGAILGGVSGAAGAASEGQDITQGALQGAAAGAAVPLVGSALGGLKQAGEQVVAGASGTLSGAGAKSLLEAMRNPSKDLISAMRGKTTQEDILKTATEAVQSIKNTQRNDYLKAIEELHGSDHIIDPKTIKNSVLESLSNFDAVSKTKSGKTIRVNFDASSLSKESAQEVKKAIQEVNQNKDWSVKGVDNLKQRVNDLINFKSDQTSKAQAAIKQVSSAITEELRKVPGYTEATQPYAKTQAFLDELTKAVNTGKNSNRETALRKLMGVMKDNSSPIRQGLIQELEKRSGENITGKIAGATLSPYFPQGLARVAEGVGAGAGVVLGAHPALLPALGGVVAASPRLSGELATKYGQLNQLAGRLVKPTVRKTVARQAAIQAGNQAGKGQ